MAIDDRRLSKLIELLDKLEWAVYTQGEGRSLFPSCPMCFGLQPGNGANNNFPDDAIGHRAGCQLHEMIKYYKSVNKTIDSSRGMQSSEPQ
jgi:hypothetical protein